MNFRKALVATIAAGTLVSLTAAAQGRRNRVTRYDPATEITVTGTIEAVQQVSRSGAWGGTHLKLKTKDETLDVHLGPSKFVADKGFTFEKGDKVEVTGSKIKYDGKYALVARTVKKGDKTLTLRDASGVPLWSRGRRR
jgi:DNA/RNA endonuclease YhcR with UshA esterase domain